MGVEAKMRLTLLKGAFPRYGSSGGDATDARVVTRTGLKHPLDGEVKTLESGKAREGSL